MKAIAMAAAVAVLGYCALCLMLYLRQRDLLYYPTPALSFARVAAEPLLLQNGGETLRIWRLPSSSERALLYFGGNAEQVSLNIDSFRQLFPDWTVYLMNYRGYGGSSGAPSETALTADALALHDRISHTYQMIGVIGRSLGSGVAAYLAAHRRVDRLALVTPYDSMAHLAAFYYPWVPVRLLLRDRYDLRPLVGRLTMPKLILIAEHDEVIPASISGALVSLLPSQTTRVTVIDGAGHNTIGERQRYAQELATFFSVH
ncbi:alpha/beta hydrolase [Desulfofustis limnaeus]|jgi:pimeloyl-ACP methyl ester carboxylesterase|uniref:Alpha/beta hydrolase n=1 Tax=Desulfofustis limnaeus TaxID=2740163 RepID=A0ABM7W910_9BACT|nr:alpha/beta fold hydrolase [Desulfofustis limnaeus]MDX9893990.1 alpha/beta fold hydrolase [Desulfofustis sp.]BDD87488.1 alpha/beta hydrolase [Desulfofustis limnaeus]